jgi:vacuolar-type H+-ATPase subunit I/STV1
MLSLRPERMTEASIICLKKDFDTTLEALDEFGNFHIEEIKEDSKAAGYEEQVRRVKETIRNIDKLVLQLKTEKAGLLDLFKAEKITKTEITAENWQYLLNMVESEISELKDKTDGLIDSLKILDDMLAELKQINQMLTILSRFKINLDVLNEMQFVHVAVVTVWSLCLLQPQLNIKMKSTRF